MDLWYRSERLVVRRLERGDIGADYLSWFNDPVVRRFIKFAKEPPGMESLIAYWREQDANERVEFLGIFDAASGAHLGNIKFEVGPGPDEAHVGFLIGNPAARGRGVLREALPACVARLRRDRGPLTIYLTVDPRNEAARAAFTRLGFEPAGAEPNGDLRMDYRGARGGAADVPR